MMIGVFKFLFLDAVYLLIFISSLGFSSAAYAYNPVLNSDSMQTYKSVQRPNHTGVFTQIGGVHLNYYNNDFSQTFYAADLKVHKTVSAQSHIVFDGLGILRAQGDGESSYTLKEFYYTNNISNGLSYSLGRKITEWSKIEDYLPAGFWNNAWDFNKANPTIEGLLGAFLNYRVSKKSKVTFFASPVSLPKTTSHYDFKASGKVESTTPWFTPPPESINYQGDSYDANYSLNLDVADLILQTQAGFIYDWSNESAFLKISYLYAPSKDVDMAIDFSLNATNPDTNVDVVVTPERAYVHKAGVEIGQRWGERGVTTLGLAYSQRGSELAIDPEDLISNVGATSGGVYQLVHQQFFLNKALRAKLHFIENTSISNAANGELDEILLDSLGVPFRYRRGAGVGLDYSLNSKLKTFAYTYYDTELDGAMGSLSFNYKWKKASFSLGYSFVEALNSNSQGFYRDFRKNDSYHMGLTYVL